jgi:hypothetical protein
MKNTLIAFLLGATAMSSSMTGEVLATDNSYGGVALQSAPLITVPKEIFQVYGIKNADLINLQVSNIVKAFEVQRDFNTFMESQRKAFEGFAAKNEQIKNDELLAPHLQSQDDAEFSRSLAAQDGIALHVSALANFALKNEQIKDDELLARHLQSQADAEFARQLQDQYDAEVEQEEVVVSVAPIVKADPRADLLSSIEGFKASNLKKAVAPVVRADPRADLLSSIKGFNASNLKKAVAPVVEVNPRADLLSSIEGFNASNLKKAVKPVVEKARRLLPVLPAILKKVEEAPQHSQEEIVPVQRDVRIKHVVEEEANVLDVLARQIAGFAQPSVDESVQTAEEAISALRLAMTESDIDELENNALIIIENALKGDNSKLSWFVSEFYTENDGWDFGFLEEDEVMKKMTKVALKKEDLVEEKPLSQQRVGRVNKLDLNADSGLSFLDQIRQARGVIEAEEDRGFVKTPVINAVEEQPVVINRTPAKKIVLKVLDEGNNSGNLLSAIAGFSLEKLNKVSVDEVEERVETTKNHLELALAARRGAIAVDSDDEDESWDDF